MLCSRFPEIPSLIYAPNLEGLELQIHACKQSSAQAAKDGPV